MSYAPEVMEELRRLAVDGLNAFAHGGRETGGVLFGMRESESIRVAAFTELEIEHALGPRFVLSEKDRSLLEELSTHAPDGLETVGWYRAHTRGGLELDSHDREMFARHFANSISLGLVLKPSHWGPATGAFYIRRASGELLPDSPQPIAIDPPKVPEKEFTEEPSASEPVMTLPALRAPSEAAVHEPASPPIAAVEPVFRTVEPAARPSWIPALCAGLIMGAALGFAAFRYVGRQSTALPVTSDRVPIAAAHVPDVSQPETPRVPPAAKVADAAARPPQTIAPSATAAPRHNAEQAAERSVAIPFPAPPPPAAPMEVKPPAVDLSAVAAVRVPDLASNPLLRTEAPAPLAAANTAPVIHDRSNGEDRDPGVPTPARVAVRAGRLIWTGVLEKHGVVELHKGYASLGAVSGEFPAAAVSLRVLPAEFGREGMLVYTPDRARAGAYEPPSKSNGWNAIHFKFDEDRARELVVIEAPNQTNDFNRLVLRNNGRAWPVVIVDWKAQ